LVVVFIIKKILNFVVVLFIKSDTKHVKSSLKLRNKYKLRWRKKYLQFINVVSEFYNNKMWFL